MLFHIRYSQIDNHVILPRVSLHTFLVMAVSPVQMSSVADIPRPFNQRKNRSASLDIAKRFLNRLNLFIKTEYDNFFIFLISFTHIQVFKSNQIILLFWQFHCAIIVRKLFATSNFIKHLFLYSYEERKTRFYRTLRTLFSRELIFYCSI